MNGDPPGALLQLWTPGDLLRLMPSDWLEAVQQSLAGMDVAYEASSSGRMVFEWRDGAPVLVVPVDDPAAAAAVLVNDGPYAVTGIDVSERRVWVRPDSLIHRAGATGATYTPSGDGTDLAGDGFGMESGARILSLKMTFPGAAVTLHDSAAIPADSAGATYWPIWNIDWGNGGARHRLRGSLVDATIPQLLSGWDATKHQYLKHITGTLTWFDREVC